jgi:hypothetical protein
VSLSHGNVNEDKLYDCSQTFNATIVHKRQSKSLWNGGLRGIGNEGGSILQGIFIFIGGIDGIESLWTIKAIG